MFFLAAKQYYDNPDNHQSILSVLDTKGLETFAENISEEKKGVTGKYAANIASTLSNDKIYHDGKKMVGHFINMSNIVSTILSIDPSYRKTMFKNSQLLGNNVGIEETFAFITSMAQAGTINASLGGLLGKLNVNELTSPLILGILYKGLSPRDIEKGVTIQDKVLRAITSDQVLNAVKMNLKVKTPQNKFINRLWYNLGTSYTDSVTGEVLSLAHLALYGEQMRRVSDFTRLESDYGSSSFDLKRNMKNLEKNLGMTLPDFLENHSDIRKRSTETPMGEKLRVAMEVKHLDDNFLANVKTKRKLQMETAIRGTFDIAKVIANLDRHKEYIEILNDVNNVINKSFVVDQNLDDVIKNIAVKIRQNEIYSENNYRTVEREVNRFYEGMFLEKNFSGDKGYNFEFNKISDSEMTKNQIRLMKLDTKLDMSTQFGRDTFVSMTPRYFRYLKNSSEYKGNYFLNAITEVPVIRNQYLGLELPNSMALDPSAIHMLAIDFNRLNENHKQFFRLYNLITNGFEDRNGSWNMFMDTAMESAYSAFLKDPLNSFDHNFIADEVIRKNGTLAEFKKVNDAEATFFRSNDYDNKMTMLSEKKGNRYVKSINPLPENVNPYFSKSVNTELNAAAPLSFDERVELNEKGSVTLGGGRWNRIGEKNSTSSDFFTKDKDSVMASDGTRLVVNKINDYQFTYTKDKTQASKITINGMKTGRDSAEGMMYFIKKAFPNMKIVLTDSSDLSNPNRDLIAYIYNGILHLNTDKLQGDTPLHELTHPITLMLKLSGDPIYNVLRDEATKFIEGDSKEAKAIRDEYSYLSKEDLYDEVISNITGWRSAEDVQITLNKWKNDNFRLSKGLWDGVKDKIALYWDRAKRMFQGAFGLKKDAKLNVDFRSDNISDFSQELFHKIMNGDVISYVDSDTLGLLSGAKYFASKIDGKVENFKDMKDILFYGTEEAGRREQMEIDSYASMIKDHQNITPDWMSKEPITFTDLTSKDSIDKIKDIIATVKRREQKFTDDNVKFLNEHKGNPKASIQYFTAPDGNEAPLYGAKVMEKYRGAILWSGKSEYINYKDLKGHKDYGYLYNENMVSDDFNPFISIETNVRGKIKISVFDVMPHNADHSDYTQPKKPRSLFRNIISDKQAVAEHLQINNTEIDLHRMYMGILLNELNGKSNVTINKFGVIEMLPNTMSFNTVDMGHINDQLRNIQNNPRLQSIRDIFIKGGLAHVLDPSFMKEFDRDFLEEAKDFYANRKDGFYMKATLDRELDNQSLLHYVNMRIKRIQEDMFGTLKNENLKAPVSIDKLTELDMLVSLVKQISSVPSMDLFIDSDKPMTHMTWAMSPTGAIDNKAFQFVRQRIIKASEMVTTEFNKEMIEFKKEGGYWDQMYKKAGVTIKGKVFNTSADVFDRLFAKAIDAHGKTIETGHIYWTADPKLDPLFGQQAADLIKAGKLDAHDLIVGKAITDLIEKNLLYQIQMNENNGRTTFYGQVDFFTEEDALKQLQDSGYRKGIIPIMPRSMGEAMAKGKVYESMSKRLIEAFDVYSDFSEQSRINIKESEDLNKMRDMFFWQFGIGSRERGSLGSNARMSSLLGLQPAPGKNNGIGYELIDGSDKVNSTISKNLEMILDYFVMTSHRNTIYESQVLPTVNAVKLIELAKKNWQDVDTTMELKAIQDFEDMKVRGKRQAITGEIVPGVKTDKLLQSMNIIATPLVLLANVNVPVVSFFGNMMFTAVEGITNSWAKAGGFEKASFGASDMIKGASRVLTPLGYKKAIQLAYDYQIFKNSEYELINLQANSRTKKSLFTRFYTNWMDYAVHGFTRALSIAAQMEKDGTWDAHVYDEVKGTITYDPKLDRRLGWDGKKYSEKGQAYLDYMTKTNAAEGLEGLGYTQKEARSIKTMGDHYLIGAYDVNTKNLITHYTLGQMLEKFKTFMVTRYENAVSKRKEIEDAGHINMVKDANGHYYAEWEKLMVEGYTRTIFNYIRDSVYNKRLTKWNELDNVEKYNIAHSAVNLSMYTSLFAMYNLLVSTKDQDKVIPNWRINRNFMYAFKSLLVAPLMYDFITKPFATVEILTNIWSKPFGQDGINIPFASQAKTVMQPFQE